MPNGKAIAGRMGLEGEFTYRSHFWGCNVADCIEYVPAAGETFESVAKAVVSRSWYSKVVDKSRIEMRIREGYDLAVKAKAKGFISDIPVNKLNFYFPVSWVRGDFRHLMYGLPHHPEAKVEVSKQPGRTEYYFWTEEQQRELK